jgi:hypothetical protein
LVAQPVLALLVAQVPIRNAILAQLDDKAPDVSTIAVKW